MQQLLRERAKLSLVHSRSRRMAIKYGVSYGLYRPHPVWRIHELIMRLQCPIIAEVLRMLIYENLRRGIAGGR